MSAEYMGLVFRSNLPRGEKLVLLAIADHVDDQGRGCYASYGRLVYKTDYCRRHVIRIVKAMEEKGYLEFQRHHETWGTNVWNILRDNIPYKPSYDEWKKAQENDVENVTPPVTPESPLGVTPMSPKPSIKPSLEPSGATLHPSTDPGPEYEYVDVEETDDPSFQARNERMPQTDLEKMIVAKVHQLKYIKPWVRQKLRSSRDVAWRDNPVRTYPSMEAYYNDHPELFAKYVDHCARRQRQEVGRVTVTGLLSAMAKYERYKTGWLDFMEGELGSIDKKKPGEMDWLDENIEGST